MDDNSSPKQAFDVDIGGRASAVEPSVYGSTQFQNVAPNQHDMIPPRRSSPVRAGFIEYEAPSGRYMIQGDDSQIMHYPLGAGESILVESGAMKYLSPGIVPELRMGNLMASLCGGESLFRVEYKNTSGEDGAMVGLSPPYQAKIIPISLDVLGRMVIKGGCFLAATDMNLSIRTERVKSLGGAMAGQGLLIHPLEGKGTVFLNAGGTIMFRQLQESEVLYASTGSVVAFQESCKFTVERVGGGMKMCCCGGEGMFNTKLVGPGLVILQSLSIDDLKSALGIKPQ